MGTILIVGIAAVLWAAVVLFTLALLRCGARDDAMVAASRPEKDPGRSQDA